jgi:hypothetical protein
MIDFKMSPRWGLAFFDPYCTTKISTLWAFNKNIISVHISYTLISNILPFPPYFCFIRALSPKPRPTPKAMADTVGAGGHTFFNMDIKLIA